MDRGDSASRQQDRADTAHPVDLDVISLGFQVVNGCTCRLGARYRPYRLGGRDGRIGNGYRGGKKPRSEHSELIDIAVLLTRRASRPASPSRMRAASAGCNSSAEPAMNVLSAGRRYGNVPAHEAPRQLLDQAQRWGRWLRMAAVAEEIRHCRLRYEESMHKCVHRLKSALSEALSPFWHRES